MFLVNQVFKGRFAFAMTGVLEGSKEEQMDAFVDALVLFGFECKEVPNRLTIHSPRFVNINKVVPFH